MIFLSKECSVTHQPGFIGVEVFSNPLAPPSLSSHHGGHQGSRYVYGQIVVDRFGVASYVSD